MQQYHNPSPVPPPPPPPQHQQYHPQQEQLSYGGYDQRQQQQQQQQSKTTSYGGGYNSHHAASHRCQGGGSLSPVPVAAMLAGGGGGAVLGFDAASAAAALDPHNLPRISSFDELLMLYPGGISLANAGGGSTCAAASSSGASTGGARRSPLAHEPVPGRVPSSGHGYHHASQHSQLPNEKWLDEMRVEVPGLSTEPLSGRQLMTKVRSSLEHVAQRYLPCVDFLVNCQQELRRGLTATTQPHGNARGRSRTLTAHQYYTMFVQTLPHRFHQKNQYFMEKQALQDAVHEIQKLVTDAHRVERMGSEAVKNQFLGGMKDGQSWGLRKWMSKHGNALHICTNIECIHQAVHKLDRTSDATRKLAAMLRPLAADALKKLQSEIPKTYQAHSSAHPYLPFFHRLESALRSMSKYDPDDDDVICIDDSDDDDEPEPVMSTTSSSPKASTSRKRPAPAKSPPGTVPTSPIRKRPVPPPPDPKPPPGAAAKKRKAEEITIDDDEVDDDDDEDDENDVGVNNKDDDVSACSSSSSGSDDGSVVEVIQVVNKAAANKRQNPQEGNSDYGAAAGWKCPSCSLLAYSTNETCEHCGEVNFLKDLNFFGSVEALLGGDEGSSGSLTPPPQQLFQQLLDDVNGSDGSRPESPLWLTDGDSKPKAKKQKTQPAGPVMGWPIPLPEPNTVYTSSLLMADTLDRVAALFDEGQQHFIRPPDAPRGQFWDGERYSAALKLFSTLLRRTDASYFIEPIDEDALIRAGNPPFSQVIRHPLCFRDIVASLVQDVEGGDSIVPIGMEGVLPPVGLGSWNMWRGMDLLQAIDLVFLNTLAYGRVVDDSPATQRSSHRAKTNKLRKELWDGISSIVADHVGNADVEKRRRSMPTRRADSSGFVVFKMQYK